MQYLKTFAFSIGKKYQDLVPLNDLVSPNKSPDIFSFEGWAYCARTSDKTIFLIYFENGCPQATIRGARLNSVYGAQWFNPRDGSWIAVGEGKLPSNNVGVIRLPHQPEDGDWGLKLIYEGPDDKNLIDQFGEERFQEKKNILLLVYSGIAATMILLVSLLILMVRKR